jgi:hypothetical protein
MKRLTRSLLITAALFLTVPSVWAAVQVVDADGTFYSATVELSPLRSGGQADATQIVVLQISPTGAQVRWVIEPTQDVLPDKDPDLLLVPGASGPVLLWSRRSGHFDQIALSRLEGGQWSPVRYLTNAPRNNLKPRAGVDSNGTGYVVWVVQEGGGSVSYATFDPTAGNLISSPRDLLQELVRHSPPQWLMPEADRHGRDSQDIVDPIALPDGGSEVPIAPPSADPPPVPQPHSSEPIGGTVTLNPGCTKALAAVVKNRAVWIGVLQNGSVLSYYRSRIPQGAPEGYLELFLETLLSQNCQ